MLVTLEQIHIRRLIVLCLIVGGALTLRLYQMHSQVGVQSAVTKLYFSDSVSGSLSVGRATQAAQLNSALHRYILGQPILLNQASISDLQLVPGIGPALARRIDDYRRQNGPFIVLGELQNVKSIGKKKVKIFSRYLSID